MSVCDDQSPLTCDLGIAVADKMIEKMPAALRILQMGGQNKPGIKHGVRGLLRGPD